MHGGHPTLAESRIRSCSERSRSNRKGGQREAAAHAATALNNSPTTCTSLLLLNYYGIDSTTTDALNTAA